MTDRRIEKTKKSLSDALASLILEKGYEAVTIQDIIDKANVGRSTFYAHYENKEHLLVENETFRRSLVETVVSEEPGSGKLGIHFLSLYRHIKENPMLAKAVMGKRSGDLILQYLRGFVSHHLVKRRKNSTSKDSAEQTMFRLTAEAAAAAVVGLLECWVMNDMPFTPEEMSDKSGELLARLFMS